MFQERVDQVKRKITSLVKLFESNHPGVVLPKIEILFNLRGRAAGMASRTTRPGMGMTYAIRFNRDMMINDGWQHLFENTVPHELAHIIGFATGKDFGHGPYWKRICKDLGGNGERCHKEEVTYANGKTYKYISSTGHVFTLSETRHRRVQTGTRYSYRGMGTVDKSCSYEIDGVRPAIQQPVSKEVSVKSLVENFPKIPAQQKTSKAQRVREMIGFAKINNKSPEFVMSFAFNELGMERGLARRYVLGNWSKV